jgi:Tfp pilus assembly protein PilO
MSRRGPIIAAAVAVALAVIAVVVLVLPKMGQVSDTKDQLEQAKVQEDSLRATLQSLQDAEASAPQTKQEIQQLDNQVPPTADLPALIRLLRQAADSAAVDFFTVTPGTPAADTTGSFSVIPSSITVTGKYFSLDEFLFRLETLPRAAKVTNVSITPAGETSEGATGGTPTLTMTLSVEFYTTDSSAGPGSNPGPATGTGTATGGGTTPTPAASPTLPAT